MANESQTAQKKRRERSPSYPAIDLETAIERLGTVYGIEGRHFAPTSALLEHWGYKQKSSYGMLTLAALLKYGLLDDRGSGPDREAKITDIGLAIVLPENEKERLESIKKAALMPSIINDLWAQYEGRLPSDASLRVYLLRQKNFNPSAVDDFIGVLRRTIEFAKLTESDKMGQGEGEEITVGEEEKPGETPDLFAQLLQNPIGDSKTMQNQKVNGQIEKDNTRPTRIVQIPVSIGEFAAIQLPTRMSETEWKRLFVGLVGMKPGFVETDIPPEDVPHLIEKALQEIE